MMIIDVTKPLEAVRTEDGKIVPMTFDRSSSYSEGDGFHGCFYTMSAPNPSQSNTGWYPNGKDMCLQKKWTIRNVAEAPAATFDPAKPVQTRDGRKARIVCTDVQDRKYPIAALVMDADGEEGTNIFTSTGYYYAGTKEHGADLVNVPETVTAFHTFKWLGANGRKDSLQIGRFAKADASAATCLLAWEVGEWDGVLKLTTEDGKFISAVMVPPAT